MPHRFPLIIILLSLLFSGAGFAAPTVHFGPAPSWVVPARANDQQPDLRDVADGYYMKLVEQEVNAEKGEQYQHNIRDIVSAAGVQGASTLTLNFNPAYQQLTVHQVTVWRDGKPLDKLNKSAFKVIANEEDLSMFIYNGNYSAYLILDDIRKGDKIEYAYTLTGTNPIFEKKIFNWFTLQSTDPIAQIHYCLMAAPSRTLNFKYFNNAEKPVLKNICGNSCYEWNLLNVKGVKFTGTSPAWFNPFPGVEVSEYKSWGEVADWACKINPAKEKLSGALAKRVAELKEKNKGDDAALLRTLATIVQNEVRYMGVEIGTYSHKANDPEKVYAQRYGDCKDKSLLLVSMLRNAGLLADVALVHSSHKSEIEDELPSPFAFNHAIVVAHLHGKDVWIDPTISYQGGTGADFYCPDYRRALVLAPGVTSLKVIPEVDGGDIKYTEEYAISDITKGQEPVSLTVNTVYKGNKADEMRHTLASQSKSDLEKNFLDYYSKIYPHISVSDTLIVNDDKETNVIETIETYNITEFSEYDSATHQYPVSFYAAMIRNALPSVENKKDFPIAVAYPFNIHYAVHVNAPLNWHIKHETEKIDRKAYTFTSDVSADGNRLSIEYDFAFHKDNIAPDEIVQYEKDNKKLVNEYLSYSFNYTAGVDATAAGVNYWAVLAVILWLAGSIYVFFRIYTRQTFRRVSAHFPARSIGGWLILPLLGLLFTMLRPAYFILTTGYFNSAIWHVYDGLPHTIQFQGLLLLELLFNASMCFFSTFCLVLFVHKRDILPRYIKMLYIGALVGVVVDSVYAHSLSSAVDYDFWEIMRGVVAVCVWVPYFSMAERVKETFVNAYPDLGPSSDYYITDYTTAEVTATETAPGEDDATEQVEPEPVPVE